MTRRVLFAASTASHIQNFHLPYLRRFRALGWEVDVACGPGGENIPFACRALSLPFEKKMFAPGNFKAAAALRRQMAQVPYDLVIVHTSLAAFFTRLALPDKRPAVVNMVHGYLFSLQRPGLRDRVLLVAERWMAGRTDLVLTMNQVDLDAARRKALGRRVEAVPGVGLDPARLRLPPAADRDALRQDRGIAPGAFVFLYAAEFSPRKDQALLIRALKDLPERAVLALPGQGALWEQCGALARELGVAHRVILPGQVGDMGPWYALADAAVSSSHSEGLPFNIMEAMYASLPIAATAVKGHTDLLAAEETALLFPPGDRAACAQAMAALMDDPTRCRAMGQAAHRAVLPYCLDLVLPQVMDAYLSACPHLAPTPV